jgi:mycothiol synthase
MLALSEDIRGLLDKLEIDGLRLRGFQGDDDFPKMMDVSDESKRADDIDHNETLKGLQVSYQHLVNCDPTTDMLMVEVDGTLVGYSRVWWQQVEDGPRGYLHFAQLLPTWRGTGLRRLMLRYNEHRLRAIAADHDGAAPRTFECWAGEGETDWIELLEGEGYRAIRYSFEMVRPNLDEIPDAPLPAGLEVRPVQPAEIPQIWAAAREAFRDHWGFSEAEWADDGWFAAWQELPSFKPALWQVAWDGDQVAGMVLNFIDEIENKRFNRRRGYTETICVRRPWRRRGLARALIARSLALHKAQGMTEAALGVDADNPNGALQLYTRMGYEVVKRESGYRKPLDAELSDKQRGTYEDYS